MEYKYYKLTNTTGCFYIGVTTQVYLSNRLSNHRNDFKKWKNGTSRPLNYFKTDFTFDDVKIELIEKKYFESFNEAKKRENELMDEYNPNQPKNKFLNPDYHKEYYDKNIEKMRDNSKIRSKKWRENNKEKALEVSRKSYEKNKEKNRVAVKEYHDIHKEEIKAKRSQKVKCEICDIELCRGSLTRHNNRHHKETI